MANLSRDDLRFRAALSRFAVGVVALTLLPTFYPRSRPHVWVWGLYMGIAAVEQVLIRKRLGGRLRALISGFVDIAMLTYTVHLLGSVVTPMTSLYLFAGVANALVVDVPTAWALSTAGVVAYDALVWAEQLRWLPFAPDAPEYAALGAPTFDRTLVATLFVTVFVPASTAIVAALVRAVDRREAQLVDANRRLEELSQLDPLTNLFNRRHLFARTETDLARVRRGHPLAVVMIDLDGFKKVNDSQGHLRGDVLLQEIGAALAAGTRAVDLVGRYGGDEFVVLLPDTDLEEARVAAERLVRDVREVGLRYDGKRPVTASVGIAMAAPGDTVATLLRRADANAYRAKVAGGDRVVTGDPGDAPSERSTRPASS